MDVANFPDAYVLLDYQRGAETRATQVYSDFAGLPGSKPSSRKRAAGPVSDRQFHPRHIAPAQRPVARCFLDFLLQIGLETQSWHGRPACGRPSQDWDR